jgi:DNA-binding NtrC family response regulator
LTSKKRILVVDDEPNIRRILQVALERESYVVATAEDAEQASSHLAENECDCVLTDVTMPGRSGYELLRECQAKLPDMPVIIITAYGTIPQAVQAIRDGAFEYVTKPFDLDNLKKVVSAALHGPAERKPRQRRGAAKQAAEFVAESPCMKEVYETVAQVADSRATVLVTGESGVGKEVVAKAVHRLSPRAAKPFVAVSCAALPETLLESELFGYEKGAFTGAQGAKPGRFEMAHEGTLFLDEIGEIPMPIQVKLLRVLQEREFERLGATKPTRVDVRLVTATNRDLREAVDAGVFRLDLLYRLQVVELYIPPLRERREDIEPLSALFLAKYCAENLRPTMRLGEEALQALLRYAWPGNVRELENTMERAVVLAGKEDTVLEARLLPPPMRRAA